MDLVFVEAESEEARQIVDIHWELAGEFVVREIKTVEAG